MSNSIKGLTRNFEAQAESYERQINSLKSAYDTVVKERDSERKDFSKIMNDANERLERVTLERDEAVVNLQGACNQHKRIWAECIKQRDEAWAMLLKCVEQLERNSKVTDAYLKANPDDPRVHIGNTLVAKEVRALLEEIS